MNRCMFAILSILDTQNEPIRTAGIAGGLALKGMEISERTVRHYLKRLDADGFTVNGTARGRVITEKGRAELHRGFAVHSGAFISDRINRLSRTADFNPETLRGGVIMNVSLVPEEKADQALEVLDEVFSSPYALCDRVAFAGSGTRIGDTRVPGGMTAIGTVCSITMNAVFMRAGIPVRPRVGGIVEVIGRKPARFQSFISYEHSSVAPLETFIRGGRTSVLDTLSTGDGCVLGSFREIPGEGLFASRRIAQRLQQCGFRNTTLYGYAFKPLLGISVTEGMVGLVDLGGLNPAAALAEAGLSVNTRAMAAIHEFTDLLPIRELRAAYRTGTSAGTAQNAAWRA